MGGTSEFSLRYLSLLSTVATVALLYVVGRRLVDRAAGLAAAFLGALSPMYLWYSQEARPYALVTCLGLLSFYCFLRAFFDTEAQPGLGGRFGIRSIPTLALFRHGRELARQAGAMNMADIVRWTRQHL